jgi:Ferritin-like domain
VTELTLEQIDRDGALAEALDCLYGHSRGEFLRRASFGGAAFVAAALALPEAAEARTQNDRNILNYDLRFEYLQATFYTEALRLGTIKRMSRERERWARVLGAHEIAHVQILKQFLGRAASRKPFFNFHGVTEDPQAFIRTAVAMEDLTVALLAGQVRRIDDRPTRAAVFSLLTVEARHAAWARNIYGFRPVLTALDEPKPISAVERIIQSTRFVARRPRTGARRRPKFTG